MDKVILILLSIALAIITYGYLLLYKMVCFILFIYSVIL